MKTNMFAIIVLAFMLVITPLAIAEETAGVTTTDNTNSDSLISPAPIDETIDASEADTETLDSETAQEIDDDLTEEVSGAKIGWAKFSLWFTFNQEKKAQKELKLARLELIRAKIAAMNEDSGAMEQALASHDEIINRVKERINNIDGASTSKGVEESTVKLIGLERAIEVHELRIQKINEILASSNLSEEQIEKVQARLAKAEENVAHLKEIEAAKKEKIRIKWMAVDNVSEEQANEKIKNVEHTQNLNTVKKKIAEVRIAHAEKTLEKLNEKSAKLEEKGQDTIKVNAKIANLKQGIGEAKILVQSGDFRGATIELKSPKVQKKTAAQETQ